MGAEGFWDDSDRAAAVSAEQARATQAPGDVHRRCSADVEDLDGLGEMAAEDGRCRPRSTSRSPRSRLRLAALEEQRLFSGRYDAGDALVTVNAGAGGTDAQDWAEMVLRMLMRWAERRGFKVELLEASAGEEAGIKSATFRASGENAYGLLGAERGVHRLGAPVAVRLGPSPPDELRGRRGGAGGQGHRRDRDRRGRPAGRHLPGLGRGRAARQQDRLGGSYHPPADGRSWCSARTSARSPPIAPTAMAMLRAKLLERSERERQEEIAREKGEAQDVNFGSQIRSYVLHPYTMVKDHRTGLRDGRRSARSRRRPRWVRARLPPVRAASQG